MTLDDGFGYPLPMVDGKPLDIVKYARGLPCAKCGAPPPQTLIGVWTPSDALLAEAEAAGMPLRVENKQRCVIYGMCVECADDPEAVSKFVEAEFVNDVRRSRQ